MELCSLGQNQLVAAARENTIHTYVELGKVIPSATIVREPEFTVCMANMQLAFCNFAIGLSLSSDRSVWLDSIMKLKRIANNCAVFRVFHLPGDAPENIGLILREGGFYRQHQLVQMAGLRSMEPSPIQMELCQTREARTEIADFMVNQFFARHDPFLRTNVLYATVEGSHELYCVRFKGKVQAALMLTRSKQAVGLYNVCVARNERGKGLGRRLVSTVQQMALEDGVPLVLQTDENLASWYKMLGMKEIGYVEAFSSSENRRNIV